MLCVLLYRISSRPLRFSSSSSKQLKQFICKEWEKMCFFSCANTAQQPQSEKIQLLTLDCTLNDKQASKQASE